MKMHDDQVEIGSEDVARLVADQFPEWRGLTVRAVPSHGTVNALFRLGDEYILRFPLQPSPSLRDELLAEQENARRIAAHVPLAVPEPVALGEPGRGYAGPWSAYRWIPGEAAAGDRLGEPDVFAQDLAGFVRAMHSMDTGGRRWDGDSRGGPLLVMDEWVRYSLSESARLTDTVTLTRLWERCLATRLHAGPDVWIHADLMPGNLLLQDGRLAAVIDLGTVCVGDPAVDLMPAWNLLPAGARDTYRHALGVDDATWERGRGWAIVQAIGALHYYVETNPVMADTAWHTLDAVME
jgi:aminoglycoside phosphotransferase (APT) family kinase protein